MRVILPMTSLIIAISAIRTHGQHVDCRLHRDESNETQYLCAEVVGGEDGATPNDNNTTNTDNNAPELVFVGNSVGNLQICQGHCHSDADCSYGLTCHERDPLTPTVDGCSGTENDSTYMNYCFPPAEGELVLLENSAIVPLKNCQGNCLDDSACDGNLQCFIRANNEAVPGCRGAGVMQRNYCYDPSNSEVPTSGPVEENETNQFFDLEYLGEPPFDSKLNACQGDCDSDWDCAFGLNCYKRADSRLIPRCTGDGIFSVDYCFFPNPGELVITIDARVVGNGAAGRCEGHCIDDSDCQGDLKCMNRKNYEDVPGCDGVGAYATNYCYDPADQNDSSSTTSPPTKSPATDLNPNATTKPSTWKDLPSPSPSIQATIVNAGTAAPTRAGFASDSSSQPTNFQTKTTSSAPEPYPTKSPSGAFPVFFPSSIPSEQEEETKTASPTLFYWNIDRRAPSHNPSNQPSSAPIIKSSTSPTFIQSQAPSMEPSMVPTGAPSSIPSLSPTSEPSDVLSSEPSTIPSDAPTSTPSLSPTSKLSSAPSKFPSDAPTSKSSLSPTLELSSVPSSLPSDAPSSTPSPSPTSELSSAPSSLPSGAPSSTPSLSPTSTISSAPSMLPSDAPSMEPSPSPTSELSSAPSTLPSDPPSSTPSLSPTSKFSSTPSTLPSDAPSSTPSLSPTYVPTIAPSSAPSTLPSDAPSSTPSLSPTYVPTIEPSSAPSMAPSNSPSITPSYEPSSVPSTYPTSFSVPSLSPTSITGSTVSLSPSRACEMIPSQRENEIKSLLSNVTMPSMFSNNSTAQARAYEWLIDEDAFYVCPYDPNVAQRYILAVLYFAANGDGWLQCSNNTSISPCDDDRFLSVSHECDWGGIGCNSDNHVISLHLGENNLNGTLPTELVQLSSLTEISMDSNALQGPIPSTLSQLQFLEIFDLDNNQLTGTLPDSFYDIHSLRVIDLDHNMLRGTISSDIGRLDELYFVQLDFNFFTGSIPSAMGELVGLKYLSVFGNNFTEAIPSVLCGGGGSNDTNLTLYANCDLCSIPNCCTACLDV